MARIYLAADASLLSTQGAGRQWKKCVDPVERRGKMSKSSNIEPNSLNQGNGGMTDEFDENSAICKKGF